MKITNELIGDVLYNSEASIEEKSIMIQKLKEPEMEEFDLKNAPIDTWDLLNKSFVSASWEDKNLILFNSNFNSIKIVTEYDGKNIKPNGLAFNNEKNEILISDCESHQIIVTDIELNKIKSVGTHGLKFNQFNNPSGICFHKNGDLYICDELNSRITVFNNDLNFKTSINLDYYPWRIKISNSTAFVKTYPLKLYIYDLESWMLKTTYDNITRVHELSPYFFTISSLSILNLYDSSGDLLDKINVERIKRNLTDLTYAFLFKFNNALILCQHPSKRVSKFK
jgi:hypothetical protein